MMPEHDSHVTSDWDGRPRIFLSGAQAAAVYSTVPYWKGLAAGPDIPFGNGRAAVSIEYIMRETQEDAEECMVDHIKRACLKEKLVYDRDEWQIHLFLINGS